MQTLTELGEAVARERHLQRLTQAELAHRAGVSPDSLQRFERGRGSEFGARKLLQILAALDLELEFVKSSERGTLDELRKERGGT